MDSTGILFVNMGSPSSEEELKYFLRKMFMDKAILPLPYPLRFILSRIISGRRYKKSWTKYEKIGGSPLKASMENIAEDLGKTLGEKFTVKCAYSYSEPSIKNTINDFKSEGIKRIKVLTAYPQSSFSTTESIKKTISKIASTDKSLQIIFIEDYYSNPFYIAFWQKLIYECISTNGLNNPHLLFSAHSIPEFHIKKGDNYTGKIEETASLIAGDTGYKFSISYQSGFGKIKWAEPDTILQIDKLKEQSCEEILIIPISFINENLETLYDIDSVIVPYALKVKNYSKVSRVNLPLSHPLLIQTFTSIIEAEK